MLYLTACLLSLVSYQVLLETKIKVIDQDNKPIEGVYIKCNNQFWYTDIDGCFLFKNKEIMEDDSLYFSHLSYKTLKLSYKDIEQLSVSSSPVIVLEEASKELKEVYVSAFNAKKYIADAIKKIPENYSEPDNSFLNVNTEVSFDRTGSDKSDEYERLRKYKGVLQLSIEDGEYYVSKIPEYEYVSKSVNDNIFFVPVYNFLRIIPIKSYYVIRKYKKFNYTEHEFLNYKGIDAVKIYFNAKNQTGFFIVDRETKAFLSIRFEEGEQDKWIIGTKKGKGLVTTGINRFIVEADFIKSSSGKYIFDSGRQNIDARNKWKTHFVSTSYNAYLKREVKEMNFSEKKKKIRDIF
jgi:hypothetical protein